MKKIQEKLITEIRILRDYGFSFKEIARKLDLSPSTSHHYGAKCKISEAGRNRLRDKIAKNQLEFTKNFAIMKPIKVPSGFSDRLVRIISHCFFDGSVASSSVNYANSSKYLVHQFIDDMREVFSIKPSLIQYYKGKFAPYYQVYFNYTLLSRYLSTYTPSYSTSSPAAIIPKQIFADFHYAGEFLRGFWEDEGAVKSDGRVVAKTKSWNMTRRLVELHNKIGIKVKFYYDKTNDAYEIHIGKNPTNLLLFDSSVGFIHSIVTRGRYKGSTKKDLFSKLVLKSRL